jgi:hypothetical protein
MAQGRTQKEKTKTGDLGFKYKTDSYGMGGWPIDAL